MSDVLKVFLGSPGDVAAARLRVHAVVDALNEDPLVQPRVEVVDWQRTPHMRNAWLPPQKVITHCKTAACRCTCGPTMSIRKRYASSRTSHACRQSGAWPGAMRRR